LDVTPAGWPALTYEQPWGAVVGRFHAITCELREAAFRGASLPVHGSAEWLVSECSGIRCDVQKPRVSVYASPQAARDPVLLERARINLATALGSECGSVEPKPRVMYSSKVDFRTGEHWIREVSVAGEPAEVA
jgi:hypothetical protein